MQLSLEHFILDATVPVNDARAIAQDDITQDAAIELDAPTPADAQSVRLIAHSPDLHPSQVLRWHVQHAPMPQGAPTTLALLRWREKLSAPIAMTEDASHEQASYFCVRVQRLEDTLYRYHYALLPEDVLVSLGGDLTSLWATVTDFEIVTNDDVTPQTLKPLPIPPPTTWTLNKRVTMLGNLIDERLQGHADIAFRLLSGVIDGSGIMLSGYADVLGERIALVNALTMLLPAPARTLLTFSTQGATSQGATHSPLIVFAPQSDDEAHLEERRHFDWQTLTFDDAPPIHPYETLLQVLWSGDVVSFTEQLRQMDALAFQMMREDDVTGGLSKVAERFHLDWQVQTTPPTGDDALQGVELVATLESNYPPQGTLRQQYVLHILAHALKERDTTSAALCIAEIDADPSLYDASTSLFQATLETEPDAVYAFVRVRCNQSSTEEGDAPWLARLRQSALRALNIALMDAPADSLAAWLRLLSREPLSFGLLDIVRDGVLRAVPRAPESPLLVRALLVIALKRTPDLLDTLLRDPNILPPLPQDDVLGRALLDNDPNAIEALIEESRELFLLAIGSALEADEAVINSALVRLLWGLQETPIAIAEAYKPAYLLRLMAQSPSEVVTKGALETLLKLYLEDEQDEAFYEACQALDEHDALLPLLATVLLGSGRNLDAMLIILNQLLTRNALVAPSQVEVAFDLLVELDWSDDALPLAELLARWLNQYPDAPVVQNHLWKLLELADRNHSETIVKVALQRILQSLDERGITSAEIAQIARCRQLTQWSANAKERIMDWWRRYTREHALSDLQKLDKALVSQKGMEDLRAIVHTTSAIRRTIGQRSLSELAEHISITHSILLAFADNFDPDNKTNTTIDTETISDLLQSREDELSADERQVLVTNLRGLVQLVTTMAENRSKPSIIRSENAIERQLATGEQAPQSAVDVIRWLARHLENDPEDD